MAAQIPTDLSDESWCIGCALIHDTDIRFTQEQAEQMGEWILCADCIDIFRIVAEPVAPSAVAE